MKKQLTWQRLKKDKKLFTKRQLRQKLIQSTRNFFLRNNFQEVETPLLVPHLIPESYLEVFETYLLDRNRHKRRMFLTTSPESSLKKLLVAGIGNCFEITKSFRNTENGSHLHNPEFSLLEWYRIPATYLGIMKDCEDWLIYLYKEVYQPSLHNSHATVRGSYPKNIITYLGTTIDLTPPWERLSVDEALQRFAGITLDDITDKSRINLSEIFSLKKISAVAEKKGYTYTNVSSWEQIFNQIFLNEVEKYLGTHGQPTIIYDYPRPLAALAKVSKEDTRIAERFEFYIAGLELGDCYNESTDSNYLKKRFLEEQKFIKRLGKTPIIPDKDFLQAMSLPLPPYSGIAVGLDRLAMLFTDSKSIDEILYFPASEWMG
ncbi:EF-P lysine aminoacylase GenX [Candidatus Gottesmanbacteria bacterium]|nr:EF-P lysine aminoacylase GenX [Candidatus Gottesmanbacteria bacterium]